MTVMINIRLNQATFVLQPSIITEIAFITNLHIYYTLTIYPLKPEYDICWKQAQKQFNHIYQRILSFTSRTLMSNSCSTKSNQIEVLHLPCKYYFISVKNYTASKSWQYLICLDETRSFLLHLWHNLS